MSSDVSQHGSEEEVLQGRKDLDLSWQDVAECAQRLTGKAADLDLQLLVGIARGGLPYAVPISHALGSPAFGVLHIDCRPAGKGAQRPVTMDNASLVTSALPDGDFTRIGVIEDIIGWGETVKLAHEVLLERYGAATEVFFLVAFLDRGRLQDGPGKYLDDRIIADQLIDNASTWITFPWEKPAIPAPTTSDALAADPDPDPRPGPGSGR